MLVGAEYHATLSETRILRIALTGSSYVCLVIRLDMIRSVSAVIAVVLTLSACSFLRPATTRRTELVLGTPCTVTIFERNADTVLDLVFDELFRLQSIFSVHDPESELSYLNSSAGEAVGVSAELFGVIGTGIAFGQISGGAFDITIGPLVKLWGIGSESDEPARIPDNPAIEEAVSRVDYEDVLLLDYEKQVLLRRADMFLDLGAIAKGFAADRIVELLKGRGVQRGLVDFGGNIFAVGEKEDGTAWRIGIQNPSEPRGNFFGIVQVRDRSVVTSGVYERYFELDGKRYHHILDPDIGYPVDNGLLSVTIVAESSMTADALSTAVFVLGVEAGLTLVENFSGVEAVLVSDTNRITLSSGASALFSKIDTGFWIEGSPR